MALPIPALPGSPALRDVVTVVVAVLLAAGLAALYARRAATARTRWVGAVLVVLSCLLYSVTPAGVSTAIIALLVGAGAGLVAGPRPWPGPTAARAAGVALAVVSVLGAWSIGGTGSSLPFVVAAIAAVVATTVLAIARAARVGPAAGSPAGPASEGRGVRRALLTVAVVGAVGLVAWTGCNDPQLSWFGPVVWHGPRDRPQVAITFDDGPNSTASLEVARMLDERGARGTFFLVGKAVAERPDIARQLVEDGHLVGNHSWRHDYWGWLNPLYPELGETQEVIGREVGVCPRFFRPPHGQRTPLMNLQVARRDMVTATWDVSAADWVTDDGELVARRVLDRVRPGSIILLHDSIDGHVDVDRQVVLDALPIILDGLERKGLEPVRLDELVGGPAYLPDDDC
ncbi:polysaccharide deacetylase family protein [Dermatobacter hominis]|uniref:polysaccharide deacetylase family protein n=1 Tax=Dermatobacter hominis TaxID=2884263 RepID=UPI001D0F9B49|nr:polysaccharide deacetylase family protein [Dermatobacter hominis]UDY35779.1 polysaccharide deacetylase family protein [Dermatobacter hominis]